jgi:hypothetical protein
MSSTFPVTVITIVTVVTITVMPVRRGWAPIRGRSLKGKVCNTWLFGAVLLIKL